MYWSVSVISNGSAIGVGVITGGVVSGGGVSGGGVIVKETASKAFTLP